MNALEPRVEARGRRRAVGDGSCEARRASTIAMEFERPCDIACADEQRDGERERIRAGIAGADPAEDGEPGKEDDKI